MGFADWKKRSEACANVLTYSVPTRSNILRAMQAAYKAGEREGRKQVEAVAENGAKLAVLVEREACAEFAEGATAYTQFQTVEHYKMAATIAAAIRERSNEKHQGPGVSPVPLDALVVRKR